MQTTDVLALPLFPFSPPFQQVTAPDTSVKFQIQIVRTERDLQFHFELKGPAVSRLVWPRASENGPQRRDELWKTTVFELFIATGPECYLEVNLSPSGDWNLYEFESYRHGMKPSADQLATPLVTASQSQAHAEVKGRLELTPFHLTGPVVLGATAVLEYDDGLKQYWALAHAGEKPDFHLRSSFIARI